MIPAAGGAASRVQLARLHLALEAAQVGLWELDLGTGALHWDDRTAAMYGTGAARTTGAVDDAHQRVHPDDVPRLRRVLALATESAGAVGVEFRIIWPDQAERWIRAHGRGVVGDSGRVEQLIGTNVDITERRRVTQERVDDAHRLSGLVAVAQALGEAESEMDLLHVVRAHGVSVLGGQNAGLCLRRSGDRVHILTTTADLPKMAADLSNLPADTALPVVHAAVTGVSLFFEDLVEVARAFPEAEWMCRQSHTEAVAEVPLTVRGELLGALSVTFADPHVWRPAERSMLRAFAALTSQALDRIRSQEAERAATSAVRTLSETLQRSLLAAPPEPNHLQIAGRYRPAAHQARVGGDWYDAFRTPDGNMMVVVGDVAGHDRDAAAAMAQARNVLRGVAQLVVTPPARVLAALDRALLGLQVDTLTTSVMCQLPVAASSVGCTVLRWSNAGHPPPVVIRPDGSAELLAREPDLLLGLDPDTPRTTHEVELVSGSSLVLYTDGLIERRGEHLDQGLARLVAAARNLHELPTEDVCDVLLHRLAPDASDDVAMLVLRIPTGTARSE